MFSDWEMIDDGSWNGVRRFMRSSDADEGTVEVKSEGIGEAQIIEENKRADGFDKKSELWHVGHVPASLGLKWLAEEGIDMWNPHHMDAVKRKLMCSDYRYLVPGMQRIIL